MRLWDPRTGQPAGDPLKGNDWSVTGLLFSPDGAILAAVNGPGTRATVWLWNPRTSQPVSDPLYAPNGMAPAIAFAADGRLLAAIGGLNQPVRVWDLRSAEAVTGPLGALDVHRGAFSPNGDTLALSSSTGVTRLFDLRPFRNPRARLLERVGSISVETWAAHVPEEPFPETPPRDPSS